MSGRFYTNLPLNPGEMEVCGSEGHHLAVVCRLRPGDPVTLFSGNGLEYPATVLEIGKNRALMQVSQPLSLSREARTQVTLASPLPKGDRADFLIEKLTELGVCRFIPLETERSLVRAKNIHREKLHRHVIEASKQCERNVLMDIGEPCDLPKAMELMQTLEKKWIAQSRLDNPSAYETAGENRVGLLIGPEGGFSPSEFAMAVSQGWKPFSLGPRILRMETAAILAAGIAVANS
ncbi:MAG: 16S rRNA (uracil(1498)-N(3))-methyltransferase [Gemmataceae bacterium]|nr:16S rRNA (uracil(1498)-N(3))-methyltransferase [Gemmataceae bacterium]